MAQFKPYKILSTELDSLPILEGQYIITTDNRKQYLDISNTTRILIGTDNSNLVNGNSEGSIRNIKSIIENSEYSLGECAFAEGSATMSSGYCSHAEGSNTEALSMCSHAEGGGSVAKGYCSHAEGRATIASGKFQHVEGISNVEDTRNKYVHIVGNGTEPGPGTNLKRSNAHTIDWDGNAWFAGNIKVGGTGQDDTNAKKLATRDEIEVKHYVWNGSSSSADETVLPLFKEMKKEVDNNKMVILTLTAGTASKVVFMLDKHNFKTNFPTLVSLPIDTTISTISDGDGSRYEKFLVNRKIVNITYNTNGEITAVGELISNPTGLSFIPITSPTNDYYFTAEYKSQPVSKGYLDGVIETSEFTKIIDIDNYLTVLTDSTEINPILNNFNETYNEEELAYLINFEGEYNNLTIPLIKYTNGINTILNYAIYNAYFILPQYDGQNAFDFIYSHKKIYSNIFYDNNDNNYYYWTLYIDMEIVEDKPKFNGCIIRKQLNIASTNYVNNICGNISTVLDSIIGQNGDTSIIS